MEIVQSVSKMRELVGQLRDKQIGLVPTMGYLHAGHLELIRKAKSQNGIVVVSIFVNPLQFGPNEDFESYPRDLARDSQLAQEAGADIIFVPSVPEMYPVPPGTHVEVSDLGDWLCGRSRPGHFKGVTTVVSKLFNIVQPRRAYFGEKDAQQLAIIKRMAADLNFPVEIVPVPIVRENDGLAMSSRNVYLTSEQRFNATSLYKSLLEAKKVFLKGERSAVKLKQVIESILGNTPEAVIDYVEICNTQTLQPIEVIETQALVALAVRFGRTRLIDNLTLTEV